MTPLYTVDDQPAWVCYACGVRYSLLGRWPKGHRATWHEDICDVCGDLGPVTEARDFGYLIPSWKDHKKKGKK